MKPMRKASRQPDAGWALEVFDRAPYVTVSMCRPDGTPYGLPLSLVRADETTFYFHCADEGEKLDCLKNNPIVSLSAVSKCTPVFEEDKLNYTEHYQPLPSGDVSGWKIVPKRSKPYVFYAKDSFLNT